MAGVGVHGDLWQAGQVVKPRSMGAWLWLASLNLQYRDFRYVVPFLVQFGLYGFQMR